MSKTPVRAEIGRLEREGCVAVSPQRLQLHAGPLTMIFDTGTAFLRYVRLGHREVLRGIYGAVRDQNWGTVTPRVSVLEHRQSHKAFRLVFDVEAQEGAIDFTWRGTLTGEADGTIRYVMDGYARSAFLRNRIGLCVLHPAAECAGQPCTVEHTDGARERGRFPREIAPHQPFRDVRAISHEVQPGVLADVSFEGEVFEMEDQRNWTDASFKTYCTPLALPFPVRIEAGTRICQAATLRLSGHAAPSDASAAIAAEVEIRYMPGDPRPLPCIGLGVPVDGHLLTRREAACVRALHLAHLRADLRLDAEDVAYKLERAWRAAAQVGARLEAALFVTDNAERELMHLRTLLDAVQPRMARWLVFHDAEKSTRAVWVRLAKRILASYEPGVPIGGGTNAFFAELNRERPPLGEMDVLAYSMNPQVHAFDDLSLFETLPVQGETVENVHGFTPGVPVAVTPVTLRPRFNPNATDARQASLLGAAWTLGSIKYLAERGAASVTYYETTGPRGVIEREAPSEALRAAPGVFPLYHVLADVGAFAGGRVRPVRSSDPLRAEGLLLEDAGRTRLLLANTSPDVQAVHLPDPAPGKRLSVRLLHEGNREQATAAPQSFRAARHDAALSGRSDKALRLELPPYAYACIDVMP